MMTKEVQHAVDVLSGRAKRVCNGFDYTDVRNALFRASLVDGTKVLFVVPDKHALDLTMTLLNTAIPLYESQVSERKKLPFPKFKLRNGSEVRVILMGKCGDSLRGHSADFLLIWGD